MRRDALGFPKGGMRYAFPPYGLQITPNNVEQRQTHRNPTRRSTKIHEKHERTRTDPYLASG